MKSTKVGVAVVAALLLFAWPASAIAADGRSAHGSGMPDLGTRLYGLGMPHGGGVFSVDVREPSPSPGTTGGDNDSNGSNSNSGTAPAGDSSRVGGSDPAPARGKPGWVWWVAGAFVVMLGVGGFRLWRSMPAAGPDAADADEPEG